MPINAQSECRVCIVKCDFDFSISISIDLIYDSPRLPVTFVIILVCCLSPALVVRVLSLYSPMLQRMRQCCALSPQPKCNIIRADREKSVEVCGSVLVLLAWLAKRVESNTFEFVEFLKFVARLCSFTFHNELARRHKDHLYTRAAR